MRKRIIPPAGEGAPPPGVDWLELQDVAEVEITSEDPANPIESALLPGGASGWRASGPGEQTIRLLFAPPQALHRIWLEFEEPTVQRTQEFVLRWSPDGGRTVHEIVRQQWNFSPHGATRQTDLRCRRASPTTPLSRAAEPPARAIRPSRFARGWDVSSPTEHSRCSQDPQHSAA